LSFSLHLLCRSNLPISRAEVASFVEDGSYFDSPPSFEPGRNGELGTLTIHYGAEKPIYLEQLYGEEAAATIAECLESLDAAPIAKDHLDRLRSSIRRTQAVIEIVVDLTAMDKNAWAMLDALEADILRTRGGLLYVYDEGVYGPDLKLWPLAKE